MDTLATAAARAHAPHSLGRRGEELAASYLEDKGLVVLSRNWRCRDGELDLVATDGKQLVVCEVKTRAGLDYGEPAEAVDETKARRIRRLANRWLSTYRVGWCELRFDIVAVLWRPGDTPRVRHLKGAF